MAGKIVRICTETWSPYSSIELDDRGVGEPHFHVRAQPLALVVGILGGVVELGLAEMMPAAVVDMDAARHAEPVDVERRQKGMQDAGVIGVLGILGVELPVVWQYLGAAAEDMDRAVQYPADAAHDLRPEISFEIGRLLAEGAEHEAGQLGDAQPRQIVVVLVELGRHSALPLDPALKGDAGQFAPEIVGPAVIDAFDLFDVALALDAQQIAAMGAAVGEGVNAALGVAGDDHRGLADRRRHVIARARDLGRETQIAPGRPLEDPLLLDPVLLGIGVKPERDLGEPVRRPRNPPDLLGAVLGHAAFSFRLIEP